LSFKTSAANMVILSGAKDPAIEALIVLSRRKRFKFM
jgi:hypothetical protein